MNYLDRTVKKLGSGKTIQIESGETIFKLDSYEKNPIVRPQDIGLTWYDHEKLQIGAVFNGGAEIFEDKIILMPRCHRNYRRAKFFDPRLGRERYCLEDYISEVWPLISEDGVHFKRFHDGVIKGDGTDHQDFVYGIEDMRIIKHDRKYFLAGCGKVKPPFKGENGDRIAIYSTDDFVNIAYHGMIECFDSRNAIPFFVDDKGYIMLRFHPNIHLAMLEGIDQLLDPSKHVNLWKDVYEKREKSLLLEAGKYPHEKEKIGPSIPLIKTDRGWLFIYHAVGEMNIDICREYGLTESIERGYSVCAAILDLDDPQKVLCRTANPIYIPSKPYELKGNEQCPVDVPAVVFPMGAVVRGDKLLIYCGAGDKYVILLSCNLNDLVNYMFKECSSR